MATTATETLALRVRYVARLIHAVLAETRFPYPGRACFLLLGTAAQESGFRTVRQYAGGPARGLWQMEPATARDHHRYLKRRELWHAELRRYTFLSEYDEAQLTYNFPYQILLARVHYYRRDPDLLPEVGNLSDAAHRWKQVWNTVKGKGTEAQYIRHYQQLVLPHLSYEAIQTGHIEGSGPLDTSSRSGSG